MRRGISGIALFVKISLLKAVSLIDTITGTAYKYNHQLMESDATKFIHENGMNREPDSRSCKFWEHGQVFNLTDGRVAEYSQTNCAHSFPIVAVFDTSDEHLSHVRKLPLHYRRFG
jgi:hypothetical protein